MLHCFTGTQRIVSKGNLTSRLSLPLRRAYASRGKPAKKRLGKLPAESSAAPKEVKIKKESVQVSKSASKEVPEPVTTSVRKSTLAVGTSFELRSLKLLQDSFSMALDRVAGPGDGGVDLVGWWWLPRLPGLPELPSTAASDEGLTPQLRSRIRVLAQCKAERSKMGPNYVREMEGVLHRVLHSPSSLSSWIETSPSNGGSNAPKKGVMLDPSLHRPIPTVAMLISQSRFTSGAVMRAMSSPIPFILLHLPPKADVTDQAEDGEETDEPEDNPSLQWNAALGSERGLLGGSLEVRWQREAGGSYPRLWWQGNPMETCVPSH